VQIHSLVAISELSAPPLGGVLYDRTGFSGVLTASLAALFIDFCMRLLVIEKKVAKEYVSGRECLNQEEPEEQSNLRQEERNGSQTDVTEQDPLLSPRTSEPKPSSKPAYTTMPILYCCSNSRLVVALTLGFIQALIIGTYDATLAIEVSSEFGFSPLQVGGIFLLCGLPNLVLAPIVGHGVDRFGTRKMSTFGFAVYVPSLALLRLPAELPWTTEKRIGVFCAVLVLNGICLALVSTASVVEAQNVVEEYVTKSPDLFGPNGPYGQLFGLTTFVFNAGLTCGPLLSAPLRNLLGYGNMYAVVAALAATASTLSFLYIGTRDRK
jgi:predicted MFS family arabinose efflux permease